MTTATQTIWAGHEAPEAYPVPVVCPNHADRGQIPMWRSTWPDRPGETGAERFQAGRIDVFHCPLCDQVALFPPTLPEIEVERRWPAWGSGEVS